MIDSHCHINQYDDPLSIAQECEIEGIITIAMTNLPSEFEDAFSWVRRYKRIRLSLGLHPLLAKYHQKELPIFERLIDKTSYIGEVGLDFSRQGKGTEKIQLESLTRVFELLKNKTRFVSIHSRNAESMVIDLMNQHNVRGAVLHWYSGSIQNLDKAVALGNYLSINTSMIGSKNGQKIIARIPPDRLLTETDGPFIKVHNRPVRPTDISMIYDYLAQTWGIGRADVEKQVKANFMTIITKLRNNGTIPHGGLVSPK